MKKVLYINFITHKNEQIFTEIGAKYAIESIFIDFDELVVFEDEIYVRGIRLDEYNFVFVGLMKHHLEMGLTLLEYLKKKKIKNFVYGGVTSRYNKLAELMFFVENNVPHIKTIVARNFDAISNLSKYNIDYPVITKPINGSKGQGVEKHSSQTTLKSVFNKFTVPLLVQPFIENDGDYRVFVFNGQILGIMRRYSQNPKKEFRNNISVGGLGEPSDLPKHVKKNIIKVVKKYDLDFAGVDIIIDKNNPNKYYFMEVNQAPQYAGLMTYLKVDVPEIIVKAINNDIK